MQMLNCSQGLVLATTAMVVSTTVAVLAYSRQKSYQEQESSPRDQPLRSCLCSSDEVRRRVNRKKKRVRFAEDVKEPMRRITPRDSLELQSQIKRGRGGCIHSSSSSSSSGYRDEFEHGWMPDNRVALYSCILRDRANRIACSY